MEMPVEVASQQATDAILTCVNKVQQVSVEDAQTLQTLMSTSCLSELSKKLILDTIDTKVQLTEAVSFKTKQELPFPENYQSMECWLVYKDPHASESTKLLRMAQRLHAIGGFNFFEPSFAAAAAVALSGCVELDESHLVMYTRQLKGLFSSLQEADKENTIRGPLNYPKTYVEFVQIASSQLIKQIDVHGPVIATQADWALLAVRKQNQPCRNTKGKKGDSRLPSGFGNAIALPEKSSMPSGLDKMLQQYKQCQQYLMAMKSYFGNPDGGLPCNITYCNPSGTRSMPSFMGSSPLRIPLPDTASTPPESQSEVSDQQAPTPSDAAANHVVPLTPAAATMSTSQMVFPYQI